jgi:hypothetical protein
VSPAAVSPAAARSQPSSAATDATSSSELPSRRAVGGLDTRTPGAPAAPSAASAATPEQRASDARAEPVPRGVPWRPSRVPKRLMAPQKETHERQEPESLN